MVRVRIFVLEAHGVYTEGALAFLLSFVGHDTTPQIQHLVVCTSFGRKIKEHWSTNIST